VQHTSELFWGLSILLGLVWRRLGVQLVFG